MDAPARIWGRTLGDESPRSTGDGRGYRGVVELGGFGVVELDSGGVDDGGLGAVLLPAPRVVSLLFVPVTAGGASRGAIFAGCCSIHQMSTPTSTRIANRS